eukprot:scaffold10133_cov135-Skeletonema_menzelii.AAC.4
MKNGDADEELAFMKRRVSFHDDTTSGEATTSNHQPAAVPTFTFEQASRPSQSTGTPSLITTFAQRDVAAIRSRKKRKQTRERKRPVFERSLTSRISLAEKHQIEQEHHNSSWFKWWHA